MHALQVAEDLLAQIEHHHLPGPLHEIGLEIVEQEAQRDQANVHGRDLSNADIRVRAQKKIKRRGFVHRHQVPVNLDGNQIGSENVGAGLDKN